MVPIFAGLVLGVGVGALSRALDIPCPAPPRMIGAVILIAMTLDYIAGGQVVGTP
jgi:XapX domain-containing protein